jgi:hypothetical protein
MKNCRNIPEEAFRDAKPLPLKLLAPSWIRRISVVVCEVCV